MGAAAWLREKIELSLAERIPAALSPRFHHAPELLATGIAEVDALLEGGLPLGGLTEITGPVCSGRSTLAASILAEATCCGASCAYVDAADAFDPLSAAAIGINLAYLLWVRAGQTGKAAIHTSTNKDGAAEALIHTPDKANTRPPAQEIYGGGSSRHPRMETHGMDIAVEKLFRNNHEKDRNSLEPVEYTPRCSESIPGRRIEQVSIDRQPARRGEVVLHKGTTITMQPHFSQSSTSAPSSQNRSLKKIWTSLDRALRATDLLLSTGGFRVIVLDIGDVRPEQVRRIPLASWYRYRLQAEKSQALFLLLTQTMCSRSCASVVLHCKETAEQWQSATESQNDKPLLTGFQYSVSAERKRALREEVYSFARKPVSSVEASWKRMTLWAR
jgi:recombination protein RecA